MRNILHGHPTANKLHISQMHQGEYELHIKSQDGKGEPKIIKLTGTGFYAFPEWSPDSKKICYTDNGRNLYLVDISTGAIKKIDSDELYSSGSIQEIYSVTGHLTQNGYLIQKY